MRTLYLWTRDLHLYAGLFAGPLVLAFAVSVLILNHPPAAAAPRVLAAAVPVCVPEGIEKLDLPARVAAARTILRQLGLDGEISFIGYNARRGTLTIPVTWPGREATVRVSLADQRATVETTRWRLADAVIWLHKMPGPHLVAIRGNWGLTRAWRWLADAFVYLVLFLSVSGIYLWAVLRAERRTGLVIAGLGVLSFAGVIYALVA